MTNLEMAKGIAAKNDGKLMAAFSDAWQFKTCAEARRFHKLLLKQGIASWHSLDMVGLK